MERDQRSVVKSKEHSRLPPENPKTSPPPRRVASDERTSHKPPLKGRHNGNPMGQPNCTLAMSRPMAFLSSRDSSLSHSRTASRPVADRQNARGIGLGLSAISRH